MISEINFIQEFTEEEDQLIRNEFTRLKGKPAI
jgi:hypothetical protein